MAISLSITPLVTAFKDGSGAYLFYHGGLTGDGSGGDVTFLLNVPSNYNPSSNYFALTDWAAFTSIGGTRFYFQITGASFPEAGLAGLYTFATFIDDVNLSANICMINRPNRSVYLGLIGTANVATWGNAIINTNTNLAGYEFWCRARLYNKPLNPA